MVRAYLDFIRAVSLDRLGRVGVVVTTTVFMSFVFMQLAMFSGVVTNSYVGLIVYLAFPVLFVLGLIIIFIAWFLQKKRTGLTTTELMESRFGAEGVRGDVAGSKVFRTVAILTFANIVILGAASIKMLHFMDSAEFCGTACHSVMNPEWTTYQASPHARVACVECHVGEGVGALVNSKLNGAWQMVSAAFDLYERPIPTPVHQLRPARETCEKCHWPNKFYGSRLQTRVSHENDEASTPRYTTLNLKIDAGAAGNTGVHWHISPGKVVRYASVDDEREEMIWVESLQPDGTMRRYTNTRLRSGMVESKDVRTMDCVDCHNRATHIYQQPDRAVDEKIRLGAIDRSLPYIRRESLAAVRGGYPSLEAAKSGIRAGIESFYRRNYPDRASAWYDRIDAAILVLEDIWARNIHPGMNIGWGAYPSFLGHSDTPGCFRCHTRDLQDDRGNWIPDDCTLCHSILAYGEDVAFAYLEPTPEKARNRAMHEYLRDEFLASTSD
ncbi:MAG: NapC/NirT family cytochrome c [Acidobacteriota bacterium]|nr:NapC/NirT family cytochrome c [Acidobacteriota bacterium]